MPAGFEGEFGPTVLSLPLALLEAPWRLTPTLTSVAAMLGLALLSTALAFMIWFRLIFRAGASNTALVTFLMPVTTLTLSVIVLNEKIDLASVVGLAIIFSGLTIAMRRQDKHTSFSNRPKPNRNTHST